MNKFTQLQTTKLGYAAEEMLINEFITSKGYTPFTPSNEGSHQIDALAFGKNGIEWMLDVKAKSRRLHYSDTGIDLADYHKYMSYDKPVYILFADILTGTVYGNWISKLTPNRENNIMYFPLDEMKEYRKLTQIEHATLKMLEQSKYY